MRELTKKEIEKVVDQLKGAAVLYRKSDFENGVDFKPGRGTSVGFDQTEDLTVITDPFQLSSVLTQLITETMSNPDVDQLVFYTCKDNAEILLETDMLKEEFLKEPGFQEAYEQFRDYPVYIGYDN